MNAAEQIIAFLIIAPVAWFALLGIGRGCDRLFNR